MASRLRFVLFAALLLAGCNAAPAAPTATLGGAILPTRVIPTAVAVVPTETPSETPAPSETPTTAPSDTATQAATEAPSETPTPTERPTSTPTDTASPTPQPTETPVPTLTPTPATPVAITVRDLVARGGPGSSYPVVATLEADTELTITGISEDGAWYQIALPGGERGWLSTSSASVDTFGNLRAVPLAFAPTETPTPTFTPSETPSVTPTFTPTDTPSPIPTPTATETPSPTVTPTDTPVPTQNFTADATNTPVPTNTKAATDTPMPTLVITAAPVNVSPTITKAVSATATSTATPTPEVAALNVSTAYQPALLSGELTLNGSLRGRIDSAQPALAYTYNGRAGEIIDVDMDALSGDLDPFLLVLDPDGRELARSDDRSTDDLDSSIGTLWLPADGSYQIIATRYFQSYGVSSGEFLLALNESSADETAAGLFSQPLRFEEVVNAELSDEVPEHTYTLLGAAGDVISAQLTFVDGEFDAVLRLSDNQGNILAFNDDNVGRRTFEPLIDGYILPADGYYTLNVLRFSQTDSDNAGTFRLKVSREDQGNADRFASIDPIASGRIASDLRFASNFAGNFVVGDGITEAGDENSVQAMLTFALPPDYPIDTATFDFTNCFEDGVFRRMGVLSLYVEPYGQPSRTSELAEPSSDAEWVTSFESCGTFDLTPYAQAAQARGETRLQLRLAFGSIAENGEGNVVLFNPTLRLTRAGT